MSNRDQFVQLCNIKSNHHLISRGIPQGSVIGPLLFNIVINDLTNATTKFDHVMYADDTTLISTLENFGPTNNAKELEQNINDEISKVATWLQCNKLKLNVSKSKFMLFYKHPKVVPKLNILVNGNPIDQVEDFNYLGITLDQHITWTPHIKKISIKISRVIGILRKLKCTFPQYILRTIYNSLIHPHLIYGLNLWWFKHKRITTLQKKAVRILAFRPYISHSISAFKELKILMLEDLYKIQLYKIYYKNTNNILPSYFQTFTPHYYNALEQGHDLRHNVVRLPLTKREYYVQCTKYQFLKLIRDTSQSDLDRSLTSSLTQFIAYFKYSIIESYNPQCTVRNCFVCARQ